MMMMFAILLTTGGLLGVLAVTLSGFRPIGGTTLRSAWWWLISAVLLWSFSWTADVLTGGIAPAIADQLWYATAILMLCPPIAVLGAKRPGARVWSAFVIVPLVLVLGWPAMTAWFRDAGITPLELEIPALLGFGLVLLMGAGNYFGTRFTGPMLIYAAAVGVLIVPFSIDLPPLFPSAVAAHCWAGLLLAVAAGWTWIIATSDPAAGKSNGPDTPTAGSAPEQPVPPDPAAASQQDIPPQRESHRTRVPVSAAAYERLWHDYRDWFGIVWAKRFLDRVNAQAEHERWTMRLEMHGFEPAPASGEVISDDLTLERIDHTLRWLLRRFADEEWINGRLEIPTWDSPADRSMVEKSPEAEGGLVDTAQLPNADEEELQAGSQLADGPPSDTRPE